MARLIANVARRGKAREAPVLPPVKRIDSMSQPGEMTSSELETSQVFAAHLGGIGATAAAATIHERRRRRTTRMRAGPVISIPEAPAADWKHRIMCDGGGSPNPGPTGCGITVATGKFATDIVPGCKRKKNRGAELSYPVHLRFGLDGAHPHVRECAYRRWEHK